MRLVKVSKLIICGALAGSLLSACDSSASPLPSVQVSTNTTTVTAPVAAPVSDANSMWTAMSKNFQLDPSVDKKEVSKQIAVLQKNQGNLARTLREAAPYLSFVYGKIREQGLPAELALLPIVESNYSPYAKSPVGASGLWQIMPKTGTGLGLKNNKGYDGRRDIVASTNAALTYLKSLNNMFKKNWELALAAYNWGPGNILKAVKKHAGVTFWTMKMPQETKNYVPKLLALAAVIKDPARYNITLPKLDNAPQLAALQVPAKVDLKKVAQSAGISEDTMRKLNPGYHDMATTHGSPNTVLVPANKVEAIKPNVTVLAVNTPSPANTAAPVNKTENVVHNVTKQSVMDMLLHRGEWLIAALANIPSTDAYAAHKINQN